MQSVVRDSPIAPARRRRHETAAEPDLPLAAASAPARASAWRIPAIDGLRAVAILMVYTYHVWEFSGSPSLTIHIFGKPLRLLAFLGQFPSGVDLFMVLSGFCLFLPLCQGRGAMERWHAKRYFVKRLRRIVPPYYAALLYAVVLPMVLVMIFRALHLSAKWQPIPAPKQWITHLLFIHTFFPSTWQEINGSFWSLGLEMQFYIVFPLLVLAIRRRGIRVIGLVVAVSVLYRVIADKMTAHKDWTTQFLYSIFFLGRWMQFGLGMWAAWFVESRRSASRTWSASRGSAIIVSAILLYIIATNTSIGVVRDLLLAISAAGAILALCLSATPARAIVESRVMLWLGAISYSVFLIHQPTAWYLSGLLQKKLHLGPMTELAFHCTLGLAMVLLVSRLFYGFFERPFINQPGSARRKAVQAITSTPSMLAGQPATP